MAHQPSTGRDHLPSTTLATARLLLRPFSIDDATVVYHTWNDESYLRFAPAGLATANGSLADAINWCTTDAEAQRRKGDALNFAVQLHNDRRLAGQVTLFSCNMTTMVTEIHYWTAPWARRKGYATEAVQAVARWAIQNLEFQRVGLKADSSNIASRRVADGAGFRYEGTMRNATLTRSGRGDLAIYSLTSDDLRQ